MNPSSDWQPLVVPPSIARSGGWLLIKASIHCVTPRGETLLRWQDIQGQPAECLLPVSRKGTLLELVYLPAGAQQLAWLASSEGAVYTAEAPSLQTVSGIESVWRRLQRVFPFYWRLSRRRRERLGLSTHLLLTDLQQAYRLVGQLRDEKTLLEYASWLARFDKLEQGDRLRINKMLGRWRTSLPRFRLHLVGDGSAHAWQRTLESVSNLCYPTSHITLIDPREAGTNSKQDQMQPNEWQWVVPVGATLAPASLCWIAHTLRQSPQCRWLYGDHDLLDEKGERHSPGFKPDWNQTLLYSQNYIGWCGLWLHEEDTEGKVPQDQEMCHQWWLTLAERLTALQIAHVPALLMHLPENNHHAEHHRAVSTYFQRHHPEVEVKPGAHGVCQLLWPLPKVRPLVSIIIPTRNGLAHLRPCIESLVHKTRYGRFEILVMDNQSDDPDTLAYFQSITNSYDVRVIRHDHPFNYSSINNEGVHQAQGEIICLLNNDTEVITHTWLDEMVAQLLRPGVGIVGAKLFYGDGRVQHGGDAVGPGGCADHFHSQLAATDPGYQRRAVSAQELSAVTAACLLTHRHIFMQLGGLNEQQLSVAFNDVDYCLRVREAGWHVVWTPHAELYHHESVSRGKDVSPQQTKRAQLELNYMRKRWRQQLKHDPFYNPNLSYDRPDFSLSRSPSVIPPWMN